MQEDGLIPDMTEMSQPSTCVPSPRRLTVRQRGSHVGRLRPGPVGSLRLDTAALFGATTSDLDIGATAGLTWIFRAFSLP